MAEPVECCADVDEDAVLERVPVLSIGVRPRRQLDDHGIRRGVKPQVLTVNADTHHLSRFPPLLAEVIEVQAAIDRDWLTSLLQDGQAAGEFVTPDPFGACVRIFVAVDGFGAYVNNQGSFEHPAFQNYVADVCAWTLGLSAAAFRAQIDAQSGGDEVEGATIGNPA